MQPHLHRWIALTALGIATLAAAPAYAVTELTGCAAKREDIQKQISQADGDPKRTHGLEKALDEVNAHCRDSSLAKRRNRKAIEAQNAVNEAERTLHKAQADNRSPEKIGKLQAKLDKAKANLSAAEAAIKQ